MNLYPASGRRAKLSKLSSRGTARAKQHQPPKARRTHFVGSLKLNERTSWRTPPGNLYESRLYNWRQTANQPLAEHGRLSLKG
ncbi:hypothetical protein KCP75_00165 [Salmonella enterica subsp. enterica]|nr:hypothetical protein KCP75_00165 [Salmonella enterica subsp. enterica]